MPRSADESNNKGKSKGYSVGGGGVNEPDAYAAPAHTTNTTPGSPPRLYGGASHL